jgi:hypothetical protein
MNLQQFKDSLKDDSPPAGLSLALQAMWQDANGDWQAAHKLAQDDGSPIGAWVHAYLHRVEGDLPNAAHWYTRAGKPRSDAPLEAEWESIVAALLGVGE